MKKLVLFTFILFVSLSMAQQNPQWHAVYQYKRVLTEKDKARQDSLIKAQPAMAEFIKKIYKRMENKIYELDFNRTESVFKEKPKLSVGKSSGFSGLRDRKLYKNIQTKIYKKTRSVPGQKYLVTDTLPDYKWQLTNETKKIGNFTAIKAIGTDPEVDAKDKKDKKATPDKITAWFTPELPIGTGPQKYWGLPGLILELHAGKDVFVLTEIVSNPKEKAAIEEPKEGKVVSEKQFRKEMKQFRENLKKRYKNRRGKSGSEKTITITM